MNDPKAGVHAEGMKKVWLASWGKSFTTYKTPAFASNMSKTIEAPAFSLFGASTPKKFFDALQGDDRENGFLNRFLVLPTKLKVASREPLYDFRDVPPVLVEQIQVAYRVRRPVCLLEAAVPEMHVIQWADGAEAVYRRFRDECEEHQPNAYFIRTAEMATRLATILAVGREAEHPKVSVDDIGWGIAVALWSSERMAKDAGMFVSDTEVGKDRARIMAKVESSPGKVCKQSAVMKDLGLSADSLHKLVRDMVEIGQLAVDERKPARGGKDIRYLRAL